MSVPSTASRPFVEHSCSRLARGLLLAVVVATSTGAQQQPTTLVPVEPFGDNYYAAGDRVDVAVPVEGDVVVAGREVTITDSVSGDILAAGWRVSFSGQTPDDVRVVGGEVKVDAAINGDLTAGGGEVIVGPKSHVTGRAWLTGRTVRVDGVFDRELRIAGGTVQLGGELRQPVTVIAERLEILPTARLLASLSYKSPVEASIAKGATIGGPISYEKISQQEATQARSWAGISSVLFAVHLLIAGLLLLALVPRLPSAIVRTMREFPGRSLLVGGALLVTTPLIALVLVLSLIGIPLGLTVGAVYLVALFLAVVTTAFYVGEWEAQLIKVGPMTTGRQRALFLLAGVLTLAVLRSVPVLGTLVVFISILFGLGALSVWTYKMYASAPAASPA